jgi:hypothetical protein
VEEGKKLAQKGIWMRKQRMIKDAHPMSIHMIHVKERKLFFSITFFCFSLIVLISPATFPHVPQSRGVCALK